MESLEKSIERGSLGLQINSETLKEALANNFLLNSASRFSDFVLRLPDASLGEQDRRRCLMVQG